MVFRGDRDDSFIAGRTDQQSLSERWNQPGMFANGMTPQFVARHSQQLRHDNLWIRPCIARARFADLNQEQPFSALRQHIGAPAEHQRGSQKVESGQQIGSSPDRHVDLSLPTDFPLKKPRLHVVSAYKIRRGCSERTIADNVVSLPCRTGRRLTHEQRSPAHRHLCCRVRPHKLIQQLNPWIGHHHE